MKTRGLVIGAATLGAWLCFAAPAVAQGKGHGNAFGHAKTTASAAPAAVTTAGASAPGGVPSGELSGVRNFASWLDDASIVEPGSGVMSFAAGYWRLAGFSELDVPSFDVGVGLARRVQVGASVPVYHASATGGPVARGIGDMYLNAKVQLREPAAGAGGRIGVALVPLVQILSAEPALGESRVSWGLPVAIEVQRQRLAHLRQHRLLLARLALRERRRRAAAGRACLDYRHAHAIALDEGRRRRRRARPAEQPHRYQRRRDLGRRQPRRPVRIARPNPVAESSNRHAPVRDRRSRGQLRRVAMRQRRVLKTPKRSQEIRNLFQKISPDSCPVNALRTSVNEPYFGTKSGLSVITPSTRSFSR